ncbi:MAG: cytochrome o ubiquinol oxidase subunit I, partial [Xanthomonas perforans]|nr:cytochrome o ubiquinol oxidase subunit I [Xanthomonas perforans]
SPPPFYNFAVLPHIDDRDQFWADKQNGKGWVRPSKYEAIHMPRNTGAGVYIGAFSVLMGFGLIWHIWWLAIIGLVGMIGSFIARTFDDDIDYWVPADEVERIENARFALLEQQHAAQAAKVV